MSNNGIAKAVATAVAVVVVLAFLAFKVLNDGKPDGMSPSQAADVQPASPHASVADTLVPSTATRPLMVDTSTLAKVFGPVTRPADATLAVVGPDAQRSIDAGLEALARAQSPDGGYRLSSQNGDDSEMSGMTALAGMAFLASGDLPTHGVYAANLLKIQNAIIQTPEGILKGKNEHAWSMYSHAFAMEFIANLALRTDDAPTREKCGKMLMKGAALTVSAQGPAGGWRYQPQPSDGDSSATAAQLVALRSAAEAGFAMDKKIPENATKYLISLQCSDGGFGYTGAEAGSAFARSAAAVAALYHCGLAGSDPAIRGLVYLNHYSPQKPGDAGSWAAAGYGYYGLYYQTQAMYLDGKSWKDWYDRTASDVISHQAKSGLWASDSGDLLSTSAALIMLQYPKGNLKAFTHESR